MVETKERAKDSLARKCICESDFVTINDDSDVVEVYIVKEIHGTTATIYALEISAEKDDIVIVEKIIALSELIHIDTSFVSVNGVMWKVRERLLNGESIETYDFLKVAI